MFCEIHFHTSETSRCGQVPAEEGIARYKEYGYDAVIVTDHFCRSYFEEYYDGKMTWNESVDRWLEGYRAAKSAGDKLGIKVFLGAELSFQHLPKNDYLVYGLTEEMLFSHKELWAMTEAEFKAFADEHRLFVAQAHPYRPFCTLCDSKYIHGVEVFNAHFKHTNDNHKAIELWHTSGLVPTCGTDHHDPGVPLGTGMLFKKEADTISDIVDMLHQREFSLIIPNINP